MSHQNLFHVIKDPVHGTMQFTSEENRWIKPFINSPTFQRLRHIKQLGMGDVIFPGAVHTRFNHCLGCCYIGSQIAHKIGLSDEDRQLVMIACLLHDIGHGPFSHAFEDIFKHTLIRHEAWTPFFLNEFRQPTFYAAYNQLNPKHPLNEEKFALIEKMIMHQSIGNQVIADIVSSQLDADRFDYLLRDSHFCGVTYGQFDLRWMLHCMAIVNSANGPRLGLTYKGLGVVEHYLVARRLMTRNIYHHHKKLAIEFFLIKLLQNLSENINEFSLYKEIKDTRLGRLLLAVCKYNQEHCNKEEAAQIRSNFLSSNYDNYKELSDYDVFALIKNLESLNTGQEATYIAERLQNRRMPKIVRIDHYTIQEAESIITEFKAKNKIQDWQLSLIETPHQSYKRKEDPILVIDEYDRVQPINEISILINAISDKPEKTLFLSIDSFLLDHSAIKSLTDKLTKK